MFARAAALACLLLAATPIPQARAVARCEDFLALMGKKPPHLAYLGCKYEPDRQGKPLSATYRVSGRFAAETEAELARGFKLRRLKRACCVWDSPAASFKDAKGREFSIRMASEETFVSSRAAWAKIGVFEVVVEAFTEEI